MSDLVETKGEDTREGSLVRKFEPLDLVKSWAHSQLAVSQDLDFVRSYQRMYREARDETLRDLIGYLEYLAPALIRLRESSSNQHAELPAFPIETLKTWIATHKLQVPTDAAQRHYETVLAKISELEAEVKEGK